MEVNRQNERHAFCIMAHTDPLCLETLIKLLDHPLNDIFIHIDKKSNDINETSLKTSFSKLIILPESQRLDVRWGGLSQVKAELALFDRAIKEDNYAFIHLLSGVDLPLKKNDEIHEFFRNLPAGTNLVSYSHGESIEKNVEFKTNYFHPFVENQRFRTDGNICHFFQDFCAKGFRFLSVNFQKKLGIKRKWNDLQLRKGSNWVSISNDFAQYLVENSHYILKKFRWVICPDEIFIHTMLFNSSFKETIWDYYNTKEDIRKIDWERGEPYTWTKDEFQELTKSKALFARKFSSLKDIEIIKAIENHILS